MGEETAEKPKYVGYGYHGGGRKKRKRKRQKIQDFFLLMLSRRIRADKAKN